MLRMRRVLSVEPFWSRGATWRPVESCVVLTSVSMYRKLQDPQPKLPLSLELDDGRSGEAGQWGEASSPAEPVSHELTFLPVSGRLVKSESEDSGVEMASNDQSPSTPVGSDKSFSLDCLDGFQPSGGDSPPLPSHESSPKADGLEDSSAGQDRAYRRNLSVSKKLAQVVQRSQKHRLPGRSPRMLNRRSRSLVDPEGLDSYHLCRPAGVDGVMGAAAGEFSQTLSGYSSPEEESIEEEVHREPSLTMPGQGLRYLEHICQMLEKIAHLQRANLQLQHQQQVMEDRIRAQELENEGIPEVALEPGPELARVEPLPEASAAPGVQGDGEEDPSPQGPWHPHHFRARSASDTRVLWSPVHNQGKKTDYSRKTASHFASSPSLMDQQDGGVHTLPPGMKFKNDHSNWGKVKVLINRITRKSAQPSEPTSSAGPAPSKPCGVDLVLGKQESHPRRHFLPTLGAKKRRSKHLSMR